MVQQGQDYDQGPRSKANRIEIMIVIQSLGAASVETLWGGVGESVRLPFTVNQMSLLLLFLGSWIMHASPPNILTQILTLTRSLIS